MPTFFGNQFTNAFITKPSVKIPPGDISGEIRYAHFDYTLPATPPIANDNIKLVRLPANVRVIDACLAFPDLGTTGTISLGWSASADGVEAAAASGLLASVDANTAADVATTEAAMIAGGALAGYLKDFASEVDIELFVNTAWTVTSGTIRGYVKYVNV